MSRDAIAEVLGDLDYPGGPDDGRDRLREVDGLLAAGVVVDVDELVIGGAQPLWHDLRKTLLPLGWRFVVAWDSEGLVIAWAPSYVTDDRIRDMAAPYVTAEAYGDDSRRVVWHPASPYDVEVDYTIMFFDNAEELLAWLGTP